jgi:hypothetical protein
MTPIKTPGLLWDAKNVTLGSIVNPDSLAGSNARFGNNAANAIYVGVTGDVHLTLMNGKDVVQFKAVTAGIWMGMPPYIHINPSPGTTATNIVAGITSG